MGIESGLIYKKNNINYLRPNKDGIVFGQKVTIDQYGFRVPSKDFKYTQNNNIFILGDSVTFGNGIKEEETFIGLLRKKIKNAFNKQVVNREMFQPGGGENVRKVGIGGSNYAIKKQEFSKYKLK